MGESVHGVWSGAVMDVVQAARPRDLKIPSVDRVQRSVFLKVVWCE